MWRDVLHRLVHHDAKVPAVAFVTGLTSSARLHQVTVQTPLTIVGPANNLPDRVINALEFEK